MANATHRTSRSGVAPASKLKYVIPTFFTCFAQILTARTEGSFLLGWSDPRVTLATEPCVNVVSLRPNAVFPPRPNR